jgi:hypothetical protein
MPADIEVSEHLFKLVLMADVVVAVQRTEKQAFAEFARTDKEMVGVRFVFQQFDKLRFINIGIAAQHNFSEVRYAVGQAFDGLQCIHFLLFLI